MISYRSLLYSTTILYDIYVCVCLSYNIGKSDLPDIYVLARGLQAQGREHIYQAIARVISDIYHKGICHIRQIKKKFKPTIRTIFIC